MYQYVHQITSKIHLYAEWTNQARIILFEESEKNVSMVFWETFSCDDTLTLKHREMHGCIVSTVATDALVLKHQAISIHNAD